MNPQDGPQSIRQVSGTSPGVLDPTQPSRILQTQASVLSFASYEPRAATSQRIPDLGNLSLDDDHSGRCRPKRIVIETTPGRGNFWRFVPNAVREQYVEDEGTFPRLIKICGQLCECSQEQWDIYKLDPRYECCVKAFPALSVINLKPVEPPTTLPFRHINKRQTVSPYSTPKLQPESLSSTPWQSDVDESERMIIDDDDCNQKPAPHPSRRRKLPRATWNSNFDFVTKPVPNQPKPKRKADISFQSLRLPEEEENIYLEEDARNRNTKTYTPKIKKRARTLSPSSQIRTLEARRIERERRKQERREQEKEFRKQQRERRFMSEVLSEVPQAHFYNNDDCDFPDIREEDAFMEENAGNTNHDNAEVDDEDAARLAESLQKMADLEADRPLWEAAKKKREARERALEEQQRAKSEARMTQQREKQREEGEEARVRREKDQTRRREEGNEQERERLDRERRARYDQWNSGAWTTYRALERYKLVCQYFDETKFSDLYPLTFHDIPWPTLQSPFKNSPQDMTWEAVQGFFMVAKTIIRGQAYRDFLKSSVSRFHTDRWRSRKLLAFVANVEEKDCIEVAVDAVGKSLGNLWDEWKNSN